MPIRTTIDLSAVIRRMPLTELAEAFSGAKLELAELPDGRRVVLKHLPAEGDWLTRATDGAGRARRLWEIGLLARVGPLVDHTILDVQAADGHDVVIMRDARDDLLPPRIAVSHKVVRRLLTRLSAVHGAFMNESGESLCSLGARYVMFAPHLHADDAGSGAHPLGARIGRGWELFEEHVHDDLVDAVFAIHRDPDPLARRLSRFPATLLHGDAKLENLGLNRGKLVAIDWGDLTGFGPREVDVGWFALKGAARIGCSPDDVFADYEKASSRTLDPNALDLVCVGSLAQMGFRFALGAFASGPDLPEVAARQLEWWAGRAAAALDRIGSI
jgi:Phosphotransferase enzyme family